MTEAGVGDAVAAEEAWAKYEKAKAAAMIWPKAEELEGGA